MALSRAGRLYQVLRMARNRATIARKRLHGVPATASVHPSSVVAADLVTGAYAYVGRNCTIPPLVTIGQYAMLAPDVAIVGDDHNWSEPGVPIQFAGRPPQQRTTIGDDVWVGHGAILLRGVTIGAGAIVAAGAVVTKNVPAFEIWAGTPARKIRDRFETAAAQEHHLRMLQGATVSPHFADARERYETRP